MDTVISAERYHDISCGHRVVGHESKCRFFHGHNYRITFTLQKVSQTGRDDLGRVLDFSVIKELLCEWLEQNWDHKTLLWDKDPYWKELEEAFGMFSVDGGEYGFVRVDFNPTAENMAEHLLVNICPALLFEYPGLLCTQVRVEETRKCSAVARV